MIDTAARTEGSPKPFSLHYHAWCMSATAKARMMGGVFDSFRSASARASMRASHTQAQRLRHQFGRREAFFAAHLVFRVRRGFEFADASTELMKVSVLLCTVTFYANLAHSLTRSPLTYLKIDARAGHSHTILTRPLKISYDGEEGVDAGGLMKEFFMMVVRQSFDLNTGLFVAVHESEYVWFNASTHDPTDLQTLKLIGTLVGLALYNGVLVDLRFPPVLWRLLLGRRVGAEHLATLDSEVRSSFLLFALFFCLRSILLFVCSSYSHRSITIRRRLIDA